MPRLLDGKAAVVTGASQGLGAAIARALAVDGARVLLVARRVAELESVAESIRSAGGEAFVCPADVTSSGAAVEIVNAAVGQLGRLDILVNSAGVFVWKRFFELTEDDWSRSIETNLSAPYRLTQEAARVMADTRRGGAIINVASIHGEVAEAHVVPHCASKSGLIAMTRAAAEALREFDIRVNAVAPGAIEPLSADRRGESPAQKVTQADVATLVVYLSSDLARSITGSVVDCHGSTRHVLKI